MNIKTRLDKLKKVIEKLEPTVWTSEVSEDGRELRMLKNGRVVYTLRSGNIDLREI